MSIDKRLAAREFVVIAEMSTPKGVDVSRLTADAQRIQGRVDAVSIPSLESGVMRLGAQAAAVLMQQQGLEPLMHVGCRDRNRLALQADLLASHVLGIKNLLVVHDEAMSFGDHPDALSVRDLDEVGLLRAIRTLGDGRDVAGFDLEGTPRFFTGCQLGRFSDDAALDASLETARRMVDAGAHFVVVPAIFDPDRAAKVFSRVAALGVPAIATVFLIKSVAVARYISINEPGAGLSEALIKRIRQAKDKPQEYVEIAGEGVQAVRTLAQGCLVQTSGWESRIPAILEVAGL